MCHGTLWRESWCVCVSECVSVCLYVCVCVIVVCVYLVFLCVGFSVVVRGCEMTIRSEPRLEEVQLQGVRLSSGTFKTLPHN